MDKIDELLGGYDAQLAADKRAKSEKEVAEAQFADEFQRHAAAFIEPTLKNMATRLEARGHGCRVSFSPYQKGAMRSGYPEVRVVIDLKGKPSAGSANTLRFIGEIGSKTVSVHRSTAGGSGGDSRQHKLAAVDVALIETIFAQWLKDVIDQRHPTINH